MAADTTTLGGRPSLDVQLLPLFAGEIIPGLTGSSPLPGAADFALRPVGDIPGNPTTLDTLKIGRDVRSTVDFAGDEDWFRTELEAGVTYVFVLTGDLKSDVPLADPLLRLYDEAGDLLVAETRSGPGGKSFLFFEPAEDGVLFASAGGSGSDGGGYRLTAEVVPTPLSISLADLDGDNGFVINGRDALDFSGSAVAGAGDVNGDGFDDVIIGAGDAAESGQSYIVFGRCEGFPGTIDVAGLDGRNGFTLDGINAFDGSGAAVSSAGDVNGDGLDDLLIGAPSAEPNGVRSGQSYVVFGSEKAFPAHFNLADLDGQNGFVLNGVGTYDDSGRAVDSAGDVNGDGFDDLIIGAPFAGDTTYSAGQSYVVFGRGDGSRATIELGELDGSDGFAVNGIGAVGDSGFAVAGAGDVNGDGFDDVIIGAIGASPSVPGSGQSYVVFGSDDPFPATIELADLNGRNGFAIDGDRAYGFSGFAVDGAGDVNGDGFDDVIIGAPGDSFVDPDLPPGRSYVVFGSDGAFPSAFDLAELDGHNGFVLDGVDVTAPDSGIAVSGAGDVNRDGFDDLLVGALTRSDEASDAGGRGQSYVVFGHEDGFPAVLELVDLDGLNGFALDGIMDFDDSGRAVSGAGDVNHDGFDDLLIGAPFADPNGNSSGQSYVVFGGPNLPARFAAGDAVTMAALADPDLFVA